MLRSSIGRRTSDGSSGAAALEVIASASRGCFLREMTISLAAATASTYGIGRPAAKGITPTSPVTSLIEGPSDNASAVTTAVAWGTGPTVPAAFFRRIGFPATIGTTVTWVFVNGIFIPPGGTFVVWNLAANGVVDVTAVVDEQ